jgi:hypothetical protein|tara:strand:+ start:920 stop:1075 length:156 start_codon:yes stop_codon:yes gene_type:complete
MTVKRIIPDHVAEDRTYEKLNRDLDIKPADHADRERQEAELVAIKKKISNR